MEVHMTFQEKVAQLLREHPDVLDNPARPLMIYEVVKNKEAIVSANGALATWTPPESTGRSPQDTYIVRRPESEADIDWDSPNNIPMEPDTFDMIMEDALEVLSGRERLYVTARVLVADASLAEVARPALLRDERNGGFHTLLGGADR
jgi:phosphoenolpyruvate carboxykinase (ATP)